jgi:MYXO-CTERM domain-containing protein
MTSARHSAACSGGPPHAAITHPSSSTRLRPPGAVDTAGRVGFGPIMRTSALASTLLLVTLAATPASAAVVWTGDFETGDLSQFDYVLNGQVDGNVYASAVQDLVLQGAFAARIELHDEAVWPNGLRRVELQHLPDAARTAEGATTCFAWSFHLPEALPEDPGHTLGYWESQNSYQQVMAFNSNGDDLRFITQQPSYTEHWNAEGVLTPGVWHRIAMCVLWSQDPGVGTVDAWFDGEQVVTAAAAKTLADGNPHFAQIGLLRGNVDYDGVPVIYIDDVLEGDAIEDVDPPDVPGGSDSSGGESTGEPGGFDSSDGGSGNPATSGADSTGGPVGSEGGSTPTNDGGSGSSGPAGSDGGDGSGCGCRTRPGPASAWWLLALGLVVRRRSDRARRGGARLPR